MSQLLEMITSLLPSTSSAKQLQLLSLLQPVMSAGLNTRVVLCKLLAQSAQQKSDLALQSELLSKYKLLWHTLFTDADPIVVFEAKRNFIPFMKYVLIESNPNVPGISNSKTVCPL